MVTVDVLYMDAMGKKKIYIYRYIQILSLSTNSPPSSAPGIHPCRANFVPGLVLLDGSPVVRCSKVTIIKGDGDVGTNKNKQCHYQNINLQFQDKEAKQIETKWIDRFGGFNPFEKYLSKWESSPTRDENKKYLKPPPSSS